MTVRILLFVISALAPVPAAAVLIATSTANDAAPTDDPGWAHIGTRTGTGNDGTPLNGLTLIYIGNGWVLTANHVGEADLLLESVAYPRIPGSKVRFKNEDGSDADLAAFLFKLLDITLSGSRSRITAICETMDKNFFQPIFPGQFQ